MSDFQSNWTGRSTVELAKDVESGDKTYEAEAHDEHNGGRNLQAWGIVGVESQHVGGTGATSDRSGAVSPGSTAKPAAAHASGSSGGATWCHDSGSRGLGIGRLRLG